jgi:hypothetical protein
MAADTATPTRPEMVRRYVELSALETVGSNIAIEVTGNDWDATSQELLDKLFPADSGYEETAEWNLAETESTMLAARVFGFLASEAGRAFCLEEATRLGEIVENHARETREAMLDA